MRDTLDPILQQEEQRKLRNQLMWRLGFAALLIASVLGVISWLDRNKDDDTELSVNASAPLRIAPPVASADASEPVAASGVASEAASAPATATPEPSPTPTTTPTATLTPTTRVSGIQKPAATQAPIATAARIVSPAKPVVGIPAKPTIPDIAKPVAPAQTKSAIAVQARPAPVAPGEFSVQAGVFLHAANAEVMLKKLQSAGIPAYLETRVQIGPFANKAEAEAAVTKLKQLGINPVVNGPMPQAR